MWGHHVKNRENKMKNSRKEVTTFEEALDLMGCSYRKEGGKFIVGDPDGQDEIRLMRRGIRDFPSGVIFRNTGNVFLNGNLISSLPEDIRFENGGCVDLSYNRLSTLPKGIKFNQGGGLYLSHNQLNTLPKGIKFNQREGLNLSHNQLKTLPEGLEFKNRRATDESCWGEVDFSHNQLESLPERLEFKNEGDVDLSFNKLKTLPEGIKFGNKGKIDLRGNLSRTFEYQGKVLETAPDYTLVVLASEERGGMTIKRAEVFLGDSSKEDQKIVYVAQTEGSSATGPSAMESLATLNRRLGGYKNNVSLTERLLETVRKEGVEDLLKSRGRALDMVSSVEEIMALYKECIMRG